MRVWNTIIICWLQCCCFASAVSTNWTKPNSQSPSFADTYTVGEKIIISWSNLNVSSNDLWLTRYNTSTDQFALRIGVSLDISVPGYFDWVVALDSKEVEQDTRFILQFLPINSAYDANATPSIPSPAFNLVLVNQQSPPNGTVAPAVISSTTASTVSTASSSSTTTTVPKSSSTQEPEVSGVSGLTLGERAGVIAGGTIGILSLFAAVVYSMVIYRRYQRHKTTHLAAGEKVTGPYEVLGDKNHPHELGSKSSNLYELNASKDTITSEAGGNSVHEMGNINKKPGLHELPS